MNGKVIEYTYSSDGTRLKARYATGTSYMLSIERAIGNVWMSISEQYHSISPYTYCGSNPMNNIDLNEIV